MNRFLRCLGLLVSAVFSAGASAQAAAEDPAASSVAPPAEHRVDGFRTARFGMRAPEVRAAIARDFDSTPTIKEIENAAEGTTLLVVDLPMLDPGRAQRRSPISSERPPSG